MSDGDLQSVVIGSRVEDACVASVLLVQRLEQDAAVSQACLRCLHHARWITNSNIELLDLALSNIALTLVDKRERAKLAGTCESEVVLKISLSLCFRSSFVIWNCDLVAKLDRPNRIDCKLTAVFMPGILSIRQAAVIDAAYSGIDSANHGARSARQGVGLERASEGRHIRIGVVKREELFLLFLRERLQSSSKECFEVFGPAIARECVGEQRFLGQQQGTGCDVCAGDDAAPLAGYIDNFDDSCLNRHADSALSVSAIADVSM